MVKIIRIIVGILAFVFQFYMFLDDSRYSIKGKLTKEEKRYFNIIETYFYLSLMALYGLMIAPIVE